MTEPLTIEPLAADHARTAFLCGVPALDRYFREQVSQDVRRGVTNCFVATDHERRVTGYYTFAASSMLMAELPIEIARRLPRYPVVPTALIGRLAIDQAFRGRGLGSVLLFDAVARAQRADAAVFALSVQAKDDTAAAFYTHHGFQPFVGVERRLFLPITRAPSRG